MRIASASTAPLQVLLAVVLVALDPTRAAYRGPRHQQQPAVYDVEVREVDSETLRQIFAGQRPHGQGTFPPPYFPQHPGAPMGHVGPMGNMGNLGPMGNMGHAGNAQWYPQRPQGGAGAGAQAGNPTQTKAHFVSPSGQVYSLREINGVRVLVGPDGRWFPLDSNNNNNNNHNNVNNNNQNAPDGDEDATHGSGPGAGAPPSGPPRRPPGPTGPDYGEGADGDGGGAGGGGAKGTRDAEDCAVASETTHSGGKRACRYQLLLDERFDVLNLTLWKHDVLLPEEPDFEFAVYDKDPDNSYVGKNALHIKPTLLEDAYGAGFVLNGSLSLRQCTAAAREQCSRRASTYRVLPAARSARLTTRGTFSFRYGIVEMRVLVPEGDWIYPAITLEPVSEQYGKWYAGGQIRLPYTVGNQYLAKRADGPKTGLQVMRMGVALGKAAGQDIRPTLLEKEVRAPSNSNWRKKGFRVYRVKWTPELIEFSLDGKVVYTLRPPPTGFVAMTDQPGDHPWKAGSTMAPFDQEFFISLGVGVGGVNRFPDGGSNGEYSEHPKPWKNSSPKALLDFYKARDHWVPTWTEPAMQVSSVKVWAL